MDVRHEGGGGVCGRGMCPLPRGARKVFGVPHLATQTTNIETLNWGESKWRRIMVGGGGGGGGGSARVSVQLKNCVS